MTLYIECIHSLLMFMRYFYAHGTLDVSAIYSMGMCLNGNRVDFNMPIEGSRFLPFWQDDCFHFVSGSIPKGENWEFGSQINFREQRHGRGFIPAGNPCMRWRLPVDRSSSYALRILQREEAIDG